jgi:ribonuclease BN (tRNA processing enzyme)
MRVTILGSGDAFGSGGRFNTCLMAEAGSGRLLVDCGASSPVALTRAGIDRNGIAAILFTHFHGDHFGGLPFFLLDALFVSRRHDPLTIMGPPGLEAWVHRAMDAAFPGGMGNRFPFQIVFEEIDPDRPRNLCGSRVTAFPMVHDPRAGPCQGYRIAAEGRTFAFSGDSAWTDALVPLAAGADALLLECYTFDTVLKNHLDWRTIERHLPDLAARRIVLTHMGPSMLARRGDVPVATAEDGLVLEV